MRNDSLREVKTSLKASATCKPDAPRVAGEHCRFCAAGAVCHVRADHTLKLAGAAFDDLGDVTAPDPATMTPEQLAIAVRVARQIELWAKAVGEYAFQEAQAGRVPPGMKLVAKRATRHWINPENVAAVVPLVCGISRDKLFSEPKLLSPAQVEERLNSTEVAALQLMVESRSSGMKLAHINDPKPQLVPAAEDVFEKVEI